MKRLQGIQAALKAPKNQENKFGKYMYRSCEDILEAVKPLLDAQGLALLLHDDVVLVGARYYVRATATLRDGADVLASVTAFAREEETKKGMDGSQITGAASSYARKYALNGLFLCDDTRDSDSTNTHSAESSAEAEPEEIVVIGKIESRGAKNKGGFIPYTLGGIRMEDGTEIKFSTKDKGLIDLMDQFKYQGSAIRLTAKKTEYRGYADIVAVEISDEVPF